MKTFEYSFHQHHHLMQAAAAAASLTRRETEVALDLTKPRRDSIESDTRKSSSFEDLSPDVRECQNDTTQIFLRSTTSKLSSITPEHAIQYHYKFEHTSPSTTTANINIQSQPRSPSLSIYEKFENVPLLQKIQSPPPPAESSPTKLIKNFPSHYDRYEERKMDSNQIPISFHLNDTHDDSNDLPSANISSSSSVASSQKSPSSSITSNPSMMVVTRDGKLSRPFKAYPKDPLSLAATSSILDSTSAEKYANFRKRMLEQIHAANGGSVVVNNPKMRRISHNNKAISEETNNNEIQFCSSDKLKNNCSSEKDEAYFERRKKNNAAAKKSRDRRRIKEDEIAIRAAFLERENIELKFELAAVRKQLAMYTNSSS